MVATATPATRACAAMALVSVCFPEPSNPSITISRPTRCTLCQLSSPRLRMIGGSCPWRPAEQ